MMLVHEHCGQAGDLQHGLQRLMSLSEGDRGVLDVVACGAAAIPRLRALLFQREPSGLFEPRCRVVHALMALGASDVLRGFLAADREIRDPVERAGEDAVINAAARALRGVADEAVFQRLLRLAETRRLAGPIEVLGDLRRWEALPCLIAALADDVARPAAEQAIRQFGEEAVPALVAGAKERAVQDGSESDSSIRRRRAALALLLEVTDQLRDLPPLRQWVDDEDAEIAVLGCRLALRSMDLGTREPAVRKLIGLFPAVSARLRWEIEHCLLACAEDARPLLRDRMPVAPPAEDDRSADAERRRSLLRLARRFGL